MKSGKQKREEIKAKRLLRAQQLTKIAGFRLRMSTQAGVVAADHSQLQHNTSFSLPSFYVDKAFVCRDCGAQEVWTAKQQKWWFEIAKGNIDSQAVRCRPCRLVERERIAEARRISQEGWAKKMALLDKDKIND